MDELMVAAVTFLRNKPNRSHKQSDIAKDVLRDLKVPDRGAARKRLKKSVNRAVGHLRTAKIIEQYKTAKNVRVRLTRDYEARYQRFLRRMKKRQDEAVAQQDETSKELRALLGEPFSDDAGAAVPGDIPPLPGADSGEPPDDTDCPAVQAATSQESEDEEDAEQLHRMLGGDDEETADVPEDGATSPTRSDTSAAAADLLSNLAAALGRIPLAEVSEEFNGLRVDFVVAGTCLHANIKFNPLLRALHVAILFPFKQTAALQLMHLSGKDDFISTVGIVGRAGTYSYAVRKVVLTRNRSPEEASRIVQRVLAEAAMVAKVLGGPE